MDMPVVWTEESRAGGSSLTTWRRTGSTHWSAVGRDMIGKMSPTADQSLAVWLDTVRDVDTASTLSFTRRFVSVTLA